MKSCYLPKRGLLPLLLAANACGMTIDGERVAGDNGSSSEKVEGSEAEFEPEQTGGAHDSSPATPACGDGVLDVDEECDGGARCDKDCKSAGCGNGRVDEGEECDGEPSCGVECQRVACGNGRVDEGEECDGEANCSLTCLLSVCGNSRLDDEEECEPPGVGTCGGSCTIIECGNERLDDGEECDPPREGACSTTCQEIRCGNGRRDEGEGCEPPGTAECDESCRPGGCGNGVIETERGEECDPPRFGTCDGSCQQVVCGNGRLEDGEECEPAGTSSCDTECVVIECGNGRRDTGEECDPPTWGLCNERCEAIACGDGRIDPGEQCEPSIVGASRCSSDCTTIDVSAGSEYLFTFDHDVQQWYFYSASPDYLQSGSRAVFDAQNGDVTPGALEMFAPFDGPNQKIEVQVDFANFRDYGGRVLRARLRLDSGLSSDKANPGGVKLFAKSGDDWAYASGNWGYLLPGTGWVEVTLSMDQPTLEPNPGTFDPARVRQIGVELRCFTETSGVSPATVYLDSVGF